MFAAGKCGAWHKRATEWQDTWRQHKTAPVTNLSKVRKPPFIHKHKENILFRLHSQLCIAHRGRFAKETRFTWDSPAAAHTYSLIKVACPNRKETKTPLCFLCCLRCHTKVHLLHTRTQSSTFTPCVAILLSPLQNTQLRSVWRINGDFSSSGGGSIQTLKRSKSSKIQILHYK